MPVHCRRDHGLQRFCGTRRTPRIQNGVLMAKSEKSLKTKAARHKYGCRIIQRPVEPSQTAELSGFLRSCEVVETLTNRRAPGGFLSVAHSRCLLMVDVCRLTITISHFIVCFFEVLSLLQNKRHTAEVERIAAAILSDVSGIARHPYGNYAAWPRIL